MRNHRHLGWLMVLATLFGSLLMVSAPQATAADGDPELSILIDRLTPSTLTQGATVTLAGTVTNNNDHAWSNVQAYLVIPSSPFTTRSQVDEATTNGAAYTGERVVDLESIDMMGDLASGQTKKFKVTVPYNRLGVTGAEGIYPIGIQILGTDDAGVRSNDAIARATTFVPKIDKSRPAVPTTVVWPFVMPSYLNANGKYVNPRGLVASVRPDGQLRRLLDVARSTPSGSSTVIIDPALLVGLDDLANGRHLKKGVTISDADVASLNRYVTDLVSLGRRESSWILDFDRPDDLALTQHPDVAGPLRDSIDRATEDALTSFQVTGRAVSWPSIDGVTDELLTSQRGQGEKPVIVSSSSLPRWDRRLGSVVQFDTTNGAVPLMINDVSESSVPGEDSVVRLRQRLLSDAALASLQRSTSTSSVADSLILVDPRWNPGGRLGAGDFADAFSASYTRGTTLDQKVTQSPKTVPGLVAPSTAQPLSRVYLEVASDLAIQASSLASVMADSDASDAEFARNVASALAIRWRRDQAQGIVIARARATAASAELGRVTIEGPASVTLSSAEGRFPLTISNNSSSDISVGVDLDSSNPSLRLPSVDPVAVAAGERRTITVDIDMKQQNTTTLSASLATETGQEFGAPAVFNVRSSNVGVALWIAMGLAGALVVVALIRRFHRRRTTRNDPLEDDGDD